MERAHHTRAHTATERTRGVGEGVHHRDGEGGAHHGEPQRGEGRTATLRTATTQTVDLDRIGEGGGAGGRETDCGGRGRRKDCGGERSDCAVNG